MPGKRFALIPALDVPDLETVTKLARALGEHPHVYGFKVGFSLGLNHGLPGVVAAIRAHSKKPVIYDHQKAGTDIPDTGELFAETLLNAGINEGILFPQAGAATLTAWTKALQARGLKVIVGGIMTHQGYLQSEGGFLADEAVSGMYRTALELGVTAFVVPLTRPRNVETLVQSLPFPPTAEFYSPGLGAQGGDPTAFPFLRTHYLIVGRRLLQAPDPVAWIDGQVSSWGDVA